MPYKWMLAIAVSTAVVPSYLLIQGDGFGAAIIGIPSILIALAIFACMASLAMKAGSGKR